MIKRKSKKGKKKRIPRSDSGAWSDGGDGHIGMQDGMFFFVTEGGDSIGER